MSYDQKVQYINSHVAERDVRLQSDPKFKEEYFKQNPGEQEAWESRQASAAQAKEGEIGPVFIHFGKKSFHSHQIHLQQTKHWPKLE